MVVMKQFLSEWHCMLLDNPKDLPHGTARCTRSQLLSIPSPNLAIQQTIHHGVEVRRLDDSINGDSLKHPRSRLLESAQFPAPDIVRAVWPVPLVIGTEVLAFLLKVG